MIGNHDNQIPDSLEPIIGFREWNLKADKLSSPYLEFDWPSGVVEASCSQGHLAPEASCGCGLYGYFSLQSLGALDWLEVTSSRITDQEYLETLSYLGYSESEAHELLENVNQDWQENLEQINVIGVIKAWGKIEVHQTGFRAQKAEIIGIIKGIGTDSVSEYYNCPITSWSELPELVRGQGLLIKSADQLKAF